MSQALSRPICPDTVLLFEPRISYPALRVTKSKKLFKINRFFCKLALKIDENSKKIDFSFFSLFSKNFAVSYPKFQPTNNLQILDFNSSFESSQRDLPGNEIKSKIERMELNQKLTFQREWSKFVASPLRHDLPEHRITLRAED